MADYTLQKKKKISKLEAQQKKPSKMKQKEKEGKF